MPAATGPPLALTLSDHDLLTQAERALGRLDGVSAVLPDISLFVYMYVRREAVLSSQIEGTQSPDKRNRIGTDAAKLVAAPVAKEVADNAMHVLAP